MDISGNSGGSITVGAMVEYATSEVELVINGVHRKCANGKQAAKHITEHHAMKAMYVKNNRLVIELHTPLALMYITNDPTVARIAEKNGVQRVWIDLETLGKEERQKNLNTVKSHHCIHDIEVISNVLTPRRYWCESIRSTPALRRKLFRSLLLETKEAVECLQQVLELCGFAEIHIGLNDLHLSYGLTSCSSCCPTAS